MLIKRLAQAEFTRRSLLGFGMAILAVTGAGATSSHGSDNAPMQGVAKYQVKLLSVSPLRFSVRADLPIKGAALDMARSYPAELPEMAANGWPALISNLKVLDPSGEVIPFARAGKRGWELQRSYEGRVSLSYDVDFSLFASHGWSSPLESAIVDDKHIVVSGRGLFVTTGQTTTVEVDFDVQPPWRLVMPWTQLSSVPQAYVVRTVEDLTDNLLVFSTVAPDVVTAAGFTLQITAMGHWAPLRPLVRQVLGAVIAAEVNLMQYKEREVYNVVLLPIIDEGGEAYRQSFAYCYEHPSEKNRANWANTLAHEIFHYWNHARLSGVDYRSTQWFQEGFTEYIANLTLVSNKIIDPNTFAAKLSQHVKNYRHLTTTLEAIGTNKGPPLYSAGALVAFTWDVIIHAASGNRRNIGDFFRNLWRQSDGGARKYAWADIRAALQATADADWEGFYQAHIKGHEALPLDEVLQTAGLRLVKDAAGIEQVSLDPAATASARSLWLALTSGK
jgi:predicted metalloprotease with PDZ domain